MNFRTLLVTTMLAFGVAGFLATPLFRPSADVKKSQHSYSTAYRGLQVGLATLPEVIAVLGPPQTKKVNSNNMRYAFKDVDVTMENATHRINTIIITEPGFVDVNGYFIGAAHSVLEVDPRILRDNNFFSDSLIDQANGVVYHFKNDHVVEIVYGASLLL